jgi:4-aminobutyrate aminotransferase-like enzyme
VGSALRLPQRVKELGGKFTQEFRDLADDCPVVGDVRGPGMFIGLELVKDRKEKKPATEEARSAVWSALGRGLITFTGGLGNVLKVKPPLTITNDQADKLLQIMSETIHKSTRPDLHERQD